VDGHRHAVTSADGTEIGLLILGSASPAWAREIIGDLDAVLTNRTLAVSDGQGHNAMDEALELLVTQLASFFS
jgi:hypothetical protein